MYPYIEIFNRKITTYGVVSTIGLFVAAILACYLIKKEENDYYDMIVVLLISSVGLLICSHVLYGITNIDLLVRVISHFDRIKGFSDFVNIFAYIFGGSVFYGGLIGFLITAYICVKKKKLNKKRYFDIFAVIIPLFHFFGRIGCFLVGCCYGIESKIGFTFRHAMIESANHVHRFPIQLVEAGFNLILFSVLLTLYKKEKIKGKLIYIYLLSYSVARFFFEFLRGDDYRGFLFGLSTSQIISILIIIFVGIIMVYKRIKRKIKS
ncbi:MAG: prolipoprotein diacylglyceryl transferase [Bacilli bacterium]|nr:prolipoprotein diacylglyceryl transferase [Bacilli bacterium]